MSTPNSSSDAAASSSSGTSTDIRAPLWDHVLIIKRAETSGNTRWKCKYCNYNGFSSYTRVKAHLLQIKSKGVALCAKVTFEQLTEMRAKKTIPMPTAPSQGDSSANKKNKRGSGCMLEKSWTMQDRKHLDALIARAFYSGGMQDRKHLENSFFACNNSLISCINSVLN
jgi:hypothetical protein